MLMLDFSYPNSTYIFNLSVISDGIFLLFQSLLFFPFVLFWCQKSLWILMLQMYIESKNMATGKNSTFQKKIHEILVIFIMLDGWSNLLFVLDIICWRSSQLSIDNIHCQLSVRFFLISIKHWQGADCCLFNDFHSTDYWLLIASLQNFSKKMNFVDE